MEFPQKYTISSDEIKRRKKAFNSLLLTLFLSVAITLRLLAEIPLSLFLLSAAIFACILLAGWMLMQKAFDSFTKIEIDVTDESIERKTFIATEKIYAREIASIRIKRTIHKTVREIKIGTKNNQFYLNGLAEMENLFCALKEIAHPEVKIYERKESIDFDSPYFYPILGIVMGIGGVWLLGLLINMYNPSYFRVMQISLLVLSMALAGYFVFAKPLSKSHGELYQKVDRMIGIIFLTLWFVLLYFIFYSSANTW
jgi:hypothetical protein